MDHNDTPTSSTRIRSSLQSVLSTSALCAAYVHYELTIYYTTRTTTYTSTPAHVLCVRPPPALPRRHQRAARAHHLLPLGAPQRHPSTSSTNTNSKAARTIASRSTRTALRCSTGFDSMPWHTARLYHILYSELV
eukprot:5039044-Amphidinium_carterae.2